MWKTLLQRVLCDSKMTQRLLKATIHRTITALGLSEFLLSPGVTNLSWASPPIVVEKAGCAGAQSSLTLLCSWGIWHAKQPNGSLSISLSLSLPLALSESVSIMLAPWPKTVLFSCANPSTQWQCGCSHWANDLGWCQLYQENSSETLNAWKVSQSFGPCCHWCHNSLQTCQTI